MGDNTDHIDNIDLITKVLAGEANEEEIQLLQNWKAADPSNSTLFEEYKRSWESVDNVKELSKIDLDKEWSKLESTIGVSSSQDEKVIPISHTPKPSGITRVLKIAAMWLILLLPAGGVYYYITEMNVERFIAEANSTEGVLPDGSKITLNSNSMLEYEKDYGKETRKVSLEGEAYFDVEPDRAKPFIIDAGPVLIEVLGTSFYVNAMKNSKHIEVIVESGEVNVYKKSNITEKLTLEAGSKGIFSKESETLTKTTNTDENYLSWKTKKLVFRNKKLSAIVKKLNMVYHSNIVIESKEIKNCRVSGTFDRQTLLQILNVIKATLDMEVSKAGSSIILTGEGC